MLSVFMYAFNALMPILLLIFLGFWLKKCGFFTDSFLDIGNKLMFRICLPAMLFVNIYEGFESFADIKWSIVTFAVPAVLVLFIIGIVVSSLFITDKKQKGVVVQCSFRSNYAIIGTVLADGLGGAAAVAVVGILSAFVVVLFNVLAVLSLTVFSDGEKVNIKKILRNIVANPLIIGIALGLGVLALKHTFPIDTNLKFMYSAIGSLGKIASPLALLVLGGKFSFKAAGSMKKQIVIATLLRVLIAPAIALSAAIILTDVGIFDFGKTEYPAIIALFATPVAVSSSVMAAEMGSDEALASQLVVWTSIASLFTIFGFISIFRGLGLL